MYSLIWLILTFILSMINNNNAHELKYDLDIIFIVDHQELVLVNDIINIIDSLPINSRISLINFNEKIMFNLNKHGLPYNNLSAVTNTINSIGLDRLGLLYLYNCIPIFEFIHSFTFCYI